MGIPHLSNQTKSKVILTKRYEQVCDQMEVHKKIRVECLKPNGAFALFYDKVSKNIINSHSDIKRLVEIVVEE